MGNRAFMKSGVKRRDSIFWLSRVAAALIFCLTAALVSCSEEDSRQRDDRQSGNKQSIAENKLDQKQSELPQLPGQRRCLSLRVLANHVTRALQSGNLPSEEILTLCGIGQVEGFVVDSERSDVILIGRHQEGRPSLTFDDLLSAFRNAWGPGPYPYCSLDPRKENILKLEKLFKTGVSLEDPSKLKQYLQLVKEATGPQQVVVGGVETRASWAGTMIEADYHMKSVSQGHNEIEGVQSMIAMHLEQTKQAIAAGRDKAQSGTSMSRFWFHAAPCDPTFLVSDGIVWLKSCRVVVLTEGQRAEADGTLKDSANNDPLAIAFADTFSARFDHAVKAEPAYAKLENLYRLLAVAHAMRLKEAPKQAGLDFGFYLSKCPYLKPVQLKSEVPPLVNSILEQIPNKSGTGIYYVAPIVCGGVSMDLGAIRERIARNSPDSKMLAAVRHSALKSRPSGDSLWWNALGASASAQIPKEPLWFEFGMFPGYTRPVG
jgi:hypothetical protein